MVPDYIIATDATVKMEPNHESSSAYAAVILNCKTKKYTVIGAPLHHRSINYCECWAIFEALRFIKKLTHPKKKNILIVSDSKLTVMALTEWSQHVWNTKDWYHWKKKSGEIVANQSSYRRVLNYINNSNLNVRITHIRSHTDPKDMNNVTRIKYYIANSGVQITTKQTQLLIKMNDMADQRANKEREQYAKEKISFIIVKRRGDGLDHGD